MKKFLILILAIFLLNLEGLCLSHLSTNPTIKLPLPQKESQFSVEMALSKRRSVRSYSQKPLSLKELSQILWAAQGITAVWGGRTAPSAGACYPLTILVASKNVTNLKKGLYQYLPHKHCLERVSDRDLSQLLFEACLEQDFVKKASLNIIIAADYSKITPKYGNRGMKYSYIEAGSVAENIHLQAESLNLGTVIVGAFRDNKIKAFLKNKRLTPLIVMPIGKE